MSISSVSFDCQARTRMTQLRPARASKSLAIRNLGIEDEWKDDGIDESALDSDEDLAENTSEGDEMLIE